MSIGTRLALGADSSRLVGAIVRRPLVQIATGIVVGVALVALVALTFVGLFDSAPTALEAALIGGYAVVMLGVCLSACVVPLRRALQLQPADVLRADAG